MEDNQFESENIETEDEPSVTKQAKRQPLFIILCKEINCYCTVKIFNKTDIKIKRVNKQLSNE